MEEEFAYFWKGIQNRKWSETARWSTVYFSEAGEKVGFPNDKETSPRYTNIEYNFKES